MNRLQKKCLIVTTGFHLLLVLTIVFGAAFFTSRTKPDETELLTVIPSTTIDAAFSSGVKAAQPPAPTPIVPPQPPTPPTPPQPKPPEPKPEPVKQPEPEPVKPPKLSTAELTPIPTAEKPPKPAPEKPKIILVPVVRNVPKVTPETSEADAAREAAKEAKRRHDAFATAARAIKSGASSSTEVVMPGTSSVSYANYASVVKSIYTQAWTPPDDTSSDDANTLVSVTIGSDGTVISARILDKSGDARVDASVQRTLDRVTFVAPFPDGAKEKERTFKINFNLKAKRMLG